MDMDDASPHIRFLFLTFLFKNKNLIEF
jgi:hypothetical protein